MHLWYSFTINFDFALQTTIAGFTQGEFADVLWA